MLLKPSDFSYTLLYRKGVLSSGPDTLSRMYETDEQEEPLTKTVGTMTDSDLLHTVGMITQNPSTLNCNELRRSPRLLERANKNTDNFTLHSSNTARNNDRNSTTTTFKPRK